MFVLQITSREFYFYSAGRKGRVLVLHVLTDRSIETRVGLLVFHVYKESFVSLTLSSFPQVINVNSLEYIPSFTFHTHSHTLTHVL